MYYSAIGILAVLILLIENQDILFKRGLDFPAWRIYRGFLISVLVYYFTDILWGLLESWKLALPLFIDTMVYFVAMAVSVLYWTKYAVTYLDEKSFFGRFLLYAGNVLFVAIIAVVVVNCFIPVLFSVDADCVYHASPLRYANLGIHVLLLLLTSAYALRLIRRGASRKHYRTIAVFGLVVALFLTIQLWYPYLPLYTTAYMLGISILHTFVVNDEKEEYRAELVGALEREKRQHAQLRTAMELAYTDPLTGVKSKHAFIEAEQALDRRIDGGETPEFGVFVFDMNDLKKINDTQGHEVGDQYLKDACTLICDCFKHSPVYRIGGDEFAAVTERADYENMGELLDGFDRQVEENAAQGRVVIACGSARFDPQTDNSFSVVFERADERRYIRKRMMKA